MVRRFTLAVVTLLSSIFVQAAASCLAISSSGSSVNKRPQLQVYIPSRTEDEEAKRLPSPYYLESRKKKKDTCCTIQCNVVPSRGTIIRQGTIHFDLHAPTPVPCSTVSYQLSSSASSISSSSSDSSDEDSPNMAYYRLRYLQEWARYANRNQWYGRKCSYIGGLSQRKNPEWQHLQVNS
jgi:hypothetical protein